MAAVQTRAKRAIRDEYGHGRDGVGLPVAAPRLLAAMKRGAAVVNLARGGHVVDADLLAALGSGSVGHAVLDVFTTEPLPPGHAGWSHPRITVLPHAAVMTDVRSAAGLAADNILAWREGRPIANLADRLKGYQALRIARTPGKEMQALRRPARRQLP